jgi:cell fate (sporulation/competence/biofilm development) regulator YlbF (YheA/YmcA/DUF963 family)
LEIPVADEKQILASASALGSMIASHPAIITYRELMRQLDLDISARNLLEQFQQVMEVLAMKEATGQPLDLQEKQQFQSLQQSVAMHPLLKKIMQGQVDYTNLMRAVQEAINAGLAKGPAGQILTDTSESEPAAAPAPSPSPASKIILG